MLEAVRRLRQEWIDFTSGAIAIPSFAGQEEEMAQYVRCDTYRAMAVVSEPRPA